jgi:hypothetical protein
VEPPPALTRSRTPQDLGDPVVAGGRNPQPEPAAQRELWIEEAFAA